MTQWQAFESGLTLTDALEKFGNWRKFQSKPYSPPHSFPKNIENKAEALEALPQHIANLADALMEPGRRRADVINEFRKRLGSRKLLAFGYLSPRSIDDAPRQIPADLWPKAKINFDKSEIQSGSLKFENVRVVKPARNSKFVTPSKLQIAHSQNIEPPRPIGRPSSRKNIFAAYEALKSANEIDFSKPMTHSYAKIRAALIEQYGSERGFQNEAIRLAIKDDFQATAKARKIARKL